jgi:hypothetical protein
MQLYSSTILSLSTDLSCISIMGGILSKTTDSTDAVVAPSDASEPAISRQSDTSDGAGLVNLPNELLEKILNLLQTTHGNYDYGSSRRWIRIIQPKWNERSLYQGVLSIEQLESFAVERTEALADLRRIRSAYIYESYSELERCPSGPKGTNVELAGLRKALKRARFQGHSVQAFEKAIRDNKACLNDMTLRRSSLLTFLNAGWRRDDELQPTMEFRGLDGNTNFDLLNLALGCRRLFTEVKSFVVRNTPMIAPSIHDASWFAATHLSFCILVESLTIRGDFKAALPERKRWFSLLLRQFRNLKYLRVEWLQGAYLIDHPHGNYDEACTVEFCKVELQLMRFIMDESGLNTVAPVANGAGGVVFGRKKDNFSRIKADPFSQRAPIEFLDVDALLEPMWF